MAQLLAVPNALFRDRDFFIHDGRQLRRFRLSAPIQAFFLLLSVILIGWSGYSATQILAPSSSPPSAAAKRYSAQVAQLAAETDRRVQAVEQRQLALAAALQDQNVDPAALRRLGFIPATDDSKAARGGPFDGGSSPTFKQLFDSWKKLDTLQDGAIAIPSDKPLQTAVFTSGYGYRDDPFHHGSDFHPGIDLAAPIGTPIHATADGTIVAAGWNNGGYGNMVEIDHGKGIHTRYGHMSRVLVTDGEHVTRGQVIGLVGSTGHSTGAHCHYEVRIDNKPVNPIPFMKSTDYLLAMKRGGETGAMDQVAEGGPISGRR
jgi:murein DD-endopeptidase MepM/ murein hydrolase activator NlpD